jgi:hypothetical protein
MKELEKIKKIFFSPNEFFRSVEKESQYGKILFFVALAYIAAQLFSYLANSIFVLRYSFNIFTIIEQIFGFMFQIGFAFAIPFISAGITHLGVMIVKGKQGFFNTFKPVAYAGVVSSIYIVISSIALSVHDLIYPTDWHFIAENLSLNNIPWGYMILAGVIGIASLIHTVYVEVVGISRFQKLSVGKSLLATLIIPILILIAVGIIFLIIITLFGILIGFLAAGAA